MHHKNVTTFPPMNTRGAGRQKLTWPGQILHLFLCFCCEWFIGAIFYYMWTSGEAQTNKQSIVLDFYAGARFLFTVFVHLCTIISHQNDNFGPSIHFQSRTSSLSNPQQRHNNKNVNQMNCTEIKINVNL